MTSAQLMQTSRLEAGADRDVSSRAAVDRQARQARLKRRRRSAATVRLVLLIALTALLAAASGCESQPKLTQPMTLASPLPERQVWAVAPFENESGVSVVDGARLADLFAQEAQQVQGLDLLPVNRVIAAMRHLRLPRVATAADAQALAQLLQVDGLIIGMVTAYDPYRPPTLGLAVQLWDSAPWPRTAFNPREVVTSPTGEVAPAAMPATHPIAQASGVFDASNHDTLLALRQYSVGRTELDSPFGEDSFLVNIELYTKFVSHRLIGALLSELEQPDTKVAQNSPPN